MELDQFEGHTPGPLACVELMAFAAAPELLAEVRRLTAEADALRRERDGLAERLAEIEAQEPVAWIERITGRLASPTDEHRTRFPSAYSALIARPTPPRPAVAGTAPDVPPRASPPSWGCRG